MSDDMRIGPFAPRSPSFNGPYGMTQVDIYDFDDVMVSPLRAVVSLSIATRGNSNPFRVVIIKDATDAHCADALLPMTADKETQAQAAQWLLDLCCTRFGIEGTLFKPSDFNVTYRK